MGSRKRRSDGYSGLGSNSCIAGCLLAHLVSNPNLQVRASGRGFQAASGSKGSLKSHSGALPYRPIDLGLRKAYLYYFGKAADDAG